MEGFSGSGSYDLSGGTSSATSGGGYVVFQGINKGSQWAWAIVAALALLVVVLLLKK